MTELTYFREAIKYKLIGGKMYEMRGAVTLEWTIAADNVGMGLAVPEMLPSAAQRSTRFSFWCWAWYSPALWAFLAARRIERIRQSVLDGFDLVGIGFAAFMARAQTAQRARDGRLWWLLLGLFFAYRGRTLRYPGRLCRWSWDMSPTRLFRHGDGHVVPGYGILNHF